jgi:peptide/nickel transport system ATP-binding protein
MNGAIVLDIRGLNILGPLGQTILEDVNLTLRAGDVTAIVGETGSGKTTILNSVLGLLPRGFSVSAGEIQINGGESVDLLTLHENERRRYLGLKIGYVPQDVRSGLNPLMTARATVREAANRGTGPAKERADAAMRRAGLPDEFVRGDADRRPGKLSGGQCQRVLIPQAIVNEPSVLLLDEPTASLDPLARREVQNTIRALTNDRCAVCLVTHDIAALPGLADTVGVMYLGRIVEIGTAAAVLQRPQHPYTHGLLGCVPRLDAKTRLVPIPGDSPANADAVPGCKFHPRCHRCEDRCKLEEPRLREIGEGRKAACHVV